MTSTLHTLWSYSWWTLGTMLTPVSEVANANDEITPQVLRLCASFRSCHENQHSNENGYAPDNDRFWWRRLLKRIKAHDLRICTWNVRSRNRPGAVSQLETVLKDYKADITALQEMRRSGQGQTNLSSCDVYYSGNVSRHEFGCGFAVREDLRKLVSRFTAVDERLAAIRKIFLH